ncbi:MAG: hypothetical protein E6Q97_25710 [Desulfurellales bacterium]|nr:MAG: hypothetical protein E6Q97_25710 [Desulfurellales bacterium]
MATYPRNVNLRPLTPQDFAALTRVAAAEAGGLRSDRDAGLQAVVDTILNRVASPAFPSTVSSVVNQGAQRVNGSQFTPVAQAGGSWTQLPRAPAPMEGGLAAYLTSRAAGAPNKVGDSVNYLNPHYSSRSSMRAWGNDVVADNSGVFGAGRNIHYHGTAPGSTPAEGNFKLSPELAAQFGYANPETAAAHAILPDYITGYDTEDNGIPTPRMRPSREAVMGMGFTPEYAPSNYTMAEGYVPQPRMRPGVVGPVQTASAKFTPEEIDSLTMMDENGNYLFNNEAPGIPTPKPRPSDVFFINDVSGAPDAATVPNPTISPLAPAVGGPNDRRPQPPTPTMRPEGRWMAGAGGAPDAAEVPNPNPRGTPYAPAFPSLYGEQPTPLRSGMSTEMGGLPSLMRGPVQSQPSSLPPLDDELYAPGNQYGRNRYDNFIESQRIEQEMQQRRSDLASQDLASDLGLYRQRMEEFMPTYRGIPDATFTEKMDVGGLGNETLISPYTTISSLPNLNLTAFPRTPPSPNTFNPPADTARDWFTGNTQGYTDTAFGPPVSPPPSPALGYDQYVPWTPSAPVTARSTVDRTNDRPTMTSEPWGDTGTFMTDPRVTPPVNIMQPPSLSPAPPAAAYGSPHAAIRDAFGLPSSLMSYNGEESSTGTPAPDDLGTSDADYQQWRREHGDPEPITPAEPAADPIEEPNTNTWFPSQPTQVQPAGMPTVARPMGNPMVPKNLGVPSVIRNVVAPNRGILGGIARILGNRSPATFTPTAGMGGFTPGGVQYQIGTTNALGGANALSWQGGGGNTVTVAQDNWTGTYYGPSYS